VNVIDDDAEAARFRRLMGRYPTGVTVISTIGGSGDRRYDHAMTANSFTSVSLDPMLVSFCVELGTRFDEAVRESGMWAVSVLAEGARRHAGWFATGGRPLVGEFDSVPCHRGASGLLLIDDAVAWFECRTTGLHIAGDHAIVVGEIIEMTEAPLVDPLIFWTGAYRTVK
jgi:flavin reductase